MLANKNMEIGVIILPDHEITNEANELADQIYAQLQKHDLSVKKILNTPHISLYHLVIETSNLINIDARLKNIAQNFQPFKIIMDSSLTDTQQNIFWNTTSTKHSPAFIQLSTETINKLNPLRYKEKHKQQITDSYPSLSSEKRKLVDQFGTFYFFPPYLNPHITLVYNSGNDRKNMNGDFIKIADIIEPIKPSKICAFQVDRIALVQLGYSGNVEKILKEYRLSRMPAVTSKL